MDKASKAARNGPITVHGVAEVLEQHMTISECGVFAYLGNEGDIVVVVMPKVTQPTFIQVSDILVCDMSNCILAKLVSGNQTQSGKNLNQLLLIQCNTCDYWGLLNSISKFDWQNC